VQRINGTGTKRVTRCLASGLERHLQVYGTISPSGSAAPSVAHSEATPKEKQVVPPKAELQVQRLKKDHTAMAERADVAAQNFAATSGLTEVFCALNLSADVHEQCLARTVQWFQDVGVRSRNTSRHCTTIATMARASPSGWLRIPCAARRGSHGL
jgi:hypothetical protein